MFTILNNSTSKLFPRDISSCRMKRSKVKKRWEQITLPSEFPADSRESDSDDYWYGRQFSVRRSETIRSVSSQTSTSTVMSSKFFGLVLNSVDIVDFCN